jgi:hypothetical protein
MRKGIGFLFRYLQVSAQSNARYFDALACMDDPTLAIRELDAVTRPAATPDGSRVRPLNSPGKMSCWVQNEAAGWKARAVQSATAGG